MHTSATSVLKLINDILDFSKIQAGKLEINPRPSVIRVEVASLRHLFKNEAESKGLNLVLEVSPNVPKSVTIDVDRFKQIAINLIGNCIRFYDTGKVGRRIDYEHNGASRSDRLLMEVFDTGVGTSDESREKIFESFTQGNAGYNRDYGGTGLGLSIARQLIDLMQGALSMESEVGKGTTFNLAIPIHGQIEPSGSPTSKTSTNRKASKPLSILLAEDNPLNQKFALSFLENAGHRVALAVNGSQAISTFQTEPFDLVLMDIQMPEVDGEQATLAIREIDEADVSIVTLTANAMNDARDRHLEIGMNSVLSKPHTKEDLLELVG